MRCGLCAQASRLTSCHAPAWNLFSGPEGNADKLKLSADMHGSLPGAKSAPMKDHSPMSGGLPPPWMYVVMRCRMVTLAKVMKSDTLLKLYGGPDLKLLKEASYLRQP